MGLIFSLKMNTDGSMNSAQQQQFLQNIMQIQQQQSPYYQENAATPPMKVNYQVYINHGHLIFFSHSRVSKNREQV